MKALKSLPLKHICSKKTRYPLLYIDNVPIAIYQPITHLRHPSHLFDYTIEKKQ